jgi:hypothetical protein
MIVLLLPNMSNNDNQQHLLGLLKIGMQKYLQQKLLQCFFLIASFVSPVGFSRG